MEYNGRFGSELILDLRTDDANQAMNYTYVRNWVLSLILDIGMEIHEINGIPAIMTDKWKPDDIPSADGVSCLAMLTTSSLSVHTSIDERNKDKACIFVNIFSCKDFKYDDVMKNCRHWWEGCEVMKWMHIDRI